MMSRIAIFFSAFVMVLLSQSSLAAGGKVFYTMDNKGDLVQPIGYREWVYVGTAITPDDMNNGKAPFPAFHNIYIDPKSYEYWGKVGEFRDSTILIKERLDVGSKAAASGNGYFMGDFIGLEAAIKSKSLFPDEPGNWGYFSFTDSDHNGLTKTASAFPTKDCAACHGANAAEDLVFTQYYPVLKAAKGKGSK